MSDLNKCPNCGGEADNGHDRCVPPNVYFCTKCEVEKDVQVAPGIWQSKEDYEGNHAFDEARDNQD